MTDLERLHHELIDAAAHATNERERRAFTAAATILTWAHDENVGDALAS